MRIREALHGDVVMVSNLARIVIGPDGHDIEAVCHEPKA
jgi:hypothetical protein